LTVRPAAFSELRVGDVAAYGLGTSDEEVLTTHRIVKRGAQNGQPCLWARDDASGWGGRASAVHPKQVYGKVVLIEKGSQVKNLEEWGARFVSGLRIRWVRKLALVKRAVKFPFRKFLPQNKASPSNSADSEMNLDSSVSPDGESLQQAPSKNHAVPIEGEADWSSRSLPGIKRDQIYHKSDKIVSEWTEKGMVLVPIHENTADMERIFSLNESAVRVWELVDGARRVEDLCETFVKEFDVNPEKARADIVGLLGRLEEIGAIQTEMKEVQPFTQKGDRDGLNVSPEKVKKGYNWRLWIGRRLFDFSRALQFLTIGIIRPQDFLAATRSFYEDPYLISMSMKSGLKGLNSSEEGILDIVAPEPESVLVLGCAAGREAIALAKRGWQVVGVDNVSILIDGAKTNAIQSGVQIEWHCLDITRGIPLRQSFDLISLFGATYSLIPGRRWRIRLLGHCRERLKPNGRLIVSFIQLRNPLSWKHQMGHRWRKVLAWMVAGNRDCQIGDQWSMGRQFNHWFSGIDEVAEEASQAGLILESVDGVPKEVAILKLSNH